MRHRFTPMEVLALLAMLALIGLAIYGAYQTYKAQKKCTDNGGHIVKYNCRTTCSVDDDGYVTCNEYCDWRCEGANAEAHP